MPKKSARVVLTLLGSAAFGVGCSQAPAQPPADSFTSQIDFEQDPEDKQAGEQPVNGIGQTAAAPATGTGHSSHYYHRGPSLWPLLFLGGSSRPSSPTYRPGTPSSVPRGPSHVTPPPIPSHVNQASNTATHSSPSHLPTTHVTPSHSTATHSTTTHTGSTSPVSSHGFGSTGHSISGGS